MTKVMRNMYRNIFLCIYISNFIRVLIYFNFLAVVIQLLIINITNMDM